MEARLARAEERPEEHEQAHDRRNGLRMRGESVSARRNGQGRREVRSLGEARRGRTAAAVVALPTARASLRSREAPGSVFLAIILSCSGQLRLRVPFPRNRRGDGAPTGGS